MQGFTILFSLFGVALCRPAIETQYGNFSTDPLSPEDYEWLAKHTPTQRVTYPPGFKFMYVAQSGQIVENHRPSSGSYIEIVGSPGTAHSALYTAALEVGKMMRHSPSHIFSNIAHHSGAGLGVFTAQEKIVVFPEFYHLKDTAACHGRCDGSCKHTCTFDGRKYENIAGVTSTRAVVLIDNVLCNTHDPYHHHDNILVHEFGHCVERSGLSSTEKNQVTAAYNNAKAHHLWTSSSYAMANHAEYFAEGTGAFFLVNMQSSTGGMTNCPGHQCRSESEVRAHLHSHDPLLYAALSHIYTSDRPSTPSGLKICNSG
ncbi:uncharacterized protein [Littorina saxatilis]|uniref:Anthrax toxin lethal/endema factor N-/C-terminal domain-containing protein n=1 Tax=Littorina saxatilis TaxID=31220 RepID=A0AAN9AUX9_9CAEN